ncbi:elongation factor G [compost metagenome]
MTDIQQASGSFAPPEITGAKAVITGKVPVAAFMNYAVRLASMTQGKGALSLKVAEYQPCHQTDAVIALKSYNKDADPAYTSSSIFCAKGQSYSVPWDEAQEHMHIKNDFEPIS